MGRVLNCVVGCGESVELCSGLWGALNCVVGCGESVELCSGLWGVLNCVVGCGESVELCSGLWGVLNCVVGCGESVELCSGLWGECLGNTKASGFPLSLSERESVWIFPTAVSEGDSGFPLENGLWGERLDIPRKCQAAGRIFGFSRMWKCFDFPEDYVSAFS